MARLPTNTAGFQTGYPGTLAPQGLSAVLDVEVPLPPIGTIRREFLDLTLFWNAVDLERKLEAFKYYYNHNRFHASLEGDTPAQVTGESITSPTDLEQYRWQAHCRGLVQLPMAA